MGTEARIVLYAPSRAVADTAARAAFARIAQLDATLSDYRESSELLRVLLRGENIPVRVSDDLFTVLRASLVLSEETNGAFDITVGVLTARGRTPRRTRTPRTGVVTEVPRNELPPCVLLPRMGWKNVVLDTVARTVLFKSPDMRLDLGGIGKGYALDGALDVLRNHGVERALVSMGGDIVAGRAPPGSPGWGITVDDADSAHRAITLENAALSTSGDTEQFRDSAGVRLSHVIDPRTGAPLTLRLKASVRAPTGVQADGWSTAVTVMDSAARARFIAAHPEADFHVRTSGVGPAPAVRPETGCIGAKG